MNKIEQIICTLHIQCYIAIDID